MSVALSRSKVLQSSVQVSNQIVFIQPTAHIEMHFNINKLFPSTCSSNFYKNTVVHICVY